MPTEFDDNRQRREAQSGKGWGIPIAIAAFIFVIGAMIFSAAGPDRTRTAEFNNPNSNPAPIERSQPAESAIPPSGQDAPSATPAPTTPPQKSNPDGTQ